MEKLNLFKKLIIKGKKAIITILLLTIVAVVIVQLLRKEEEVEVNPVVVVEKVKQDDVEIKTYSECGWFCISGWKGKELVVRSLQ